MEKMRVSQWIHTK